MKTKELIEKLLNLPEFMLECDVKLSVGCHEEYLKSVEELWSESGFAVILNGEEIPPCNY